MFVHILLWFHETLFLLLCTPSWLSPPYAKMQFLPMWKANKVLEKTEGIKALRIDYSLTLVCIPADHVSLCIPWWPVECSPPGQPLMPMELSCSPSQRQHPSVGWPTAGQSLLAATRKPSHQSSTNNMIVVGFTPMNIGHDWNVISLLKLKHLLHKHFKIKHLSRKLKFCY